MKRSMFAIFAAFALLLSAPLAAQDETVQPYESRTNPDADSITGGSGLTITGTVVEWNDEQLQIKTATGVEHIQIVPNTQWSSNLTEGETVSVDYTRTGQGVMIASKIRTSGTLVEDTDTVTTTTTSSLNTDTEVDTDVDTTADLDVDADVDADADWNDDTMEAEADVTADFDADTDLDDQDLQADLDTEDEWDTNDELPATGSELPLLGLLGLLSLVAAIGVRTFR